MWKYEFNEKKQCTSIEGLSTLVYLNEHTKLSQSKLSQSKLSQTKLSQTKLSQTKLSQTDTQRMIRT